MLDTQLHAIDSAVDFAKQFSSIAIFMECLHAYERFDAAFAFAQPGLQVSQMRIVQIIEVPGLGFEFQRFEVQGAGTAHAPKTIRVLVAQA
ncbi:hypothetical protein D3C81_2096250 [compost metagenome]